MCFQRLSTGLSSGLRAGSLQRVMLRGTRNVVAVCQPAWSRNITQCSAAKVRAVMRKKIAMVCASIQGADSRYGVQVLTHDLARGMGPLRKRRPAAALALMDAPKAGFILE